MRVHTGQTVASSIARGFTCGVVVHFMRPWQLPHLTWTWNVLKSSPRTVVGVVAFNRGPGQKLWRGGLSFEKPLG